MSFFFSKQRDRQVPMIGERPAAKPAGRRKADDIKVLNRLGCQACPLNKAEVRTPKMQPTIAANTEIYFLAEAPGREEDEISGRPLTGPSGKLLRECIPDGKDFLCSFDNVVRDRPPKNRTPVWQEIECCRNHVVRSIEQAKPKLIVGLGAVPLGWMINSTDLSGMRGRFFACQVGSHACWYMPTYHPSFVLRMAHDKRKPLNSKFGFCFRMDITRAFTAVGGEWAPPVIEDTNNIRNDILCFEGSTPEHFMALLVLLGKAERAAVKAVDIETKGLRPYSSGAAIMSCAFSFGDTNFAFALDHPQAKWSRNQYHAILDSLTKILQDNSIKVAHNAPFEIEWFIWRLGRDVVNHAAWQCTQMQAHFLDERRGKKHGGDNEHRAPYQGLDFLCKMHFGIDLKKQFTVNKKDMSKTPLSECLIYNGADTKYTLKLYHRQEQLLKEQGTYYAYLESMPRQPSVALMQYLGVWVNQAEVKRSQELLEPEVKNLLAEVRDLKVVKQYVKDKGEFNPFSDRDTLAIFKDYLKRPEVVIQPERHEVHDFNISPEAKKRFDLDPKKVRYSTDKNVLAKIDHPLAGLIIKLRNRNKLKSTYVDGLELGKGSMIYPDGRLHTNFNTTFAETGRTSSDDPNMQNYPSRNDKWVRRQIEAEHGNILVACDYGQLEGCTAAMCSQDDALVNALWEDYDIHMEWAERIAAVYPEIVGGKDAMKDETTRKKFRSIVKNKFVFPAIFGAQVSSIAGYLNMPEDIIDKQMSKFWQMFSGLKDWQDKLMKSYYDKGWVASPTGRRRHYPLTRNQVINHPIQSLACDIVCDAMNRLSYMAMRTGQWHLHPRLNIHDDLTFSIPDDDTVLNHAIKTICNTMLTPEYECVNVPLSVEISIGKSWYGMTGLGKFWSHKDL